MKELNHPIFGKCCVPESSFETEFIVQQVMKYPITAFQALNRHFNESGLMIHIVPIDNKFKEEQS